MFNQIYCGPTDSVSFVGENDLCCLTLYHLNPQYQRCRMEVLATSSSAIWKMVYSMRAASMTSRGSEGVDFWPVRSCVLSTTVVVLHLLLLLCDVVSVICVVVVCREKGCCGRFIIFLPFVEFGAMDNETNSISSINFLTAYADSYLQSWMYVSGLLAPPEREIAYNWYFSIFSRYWQFKLFHDITTSGDGESFYNSKGQLEVNKVATNLLAYVWRSPSAPFVDGMHSWSDKLKIR